MNDDDQGALRAERERTIARLSELFASDHLELEEFEQKLSLAHRAASRAELAKVTDQLPEPSTALAPLPPTAMVPASQVRPSATMVAMLGGSTRRGAWTVPQELRVIALMGGAELDFREALLPRGVIDITVFAWMGGVHIIVPPNLAIEVHGTGIMGGFEQLARQPTESELDRPLIRVRGLVIMGGVHVETRLAGERGRDAKRRRRRERKERRRHRRLP